MPEKEKDGPRRQDRGGGPPSGEPGAGGQDGLVIRARNLSKVYGEGPINLASAVRALDDVSLDVRRGEFVSIMGASGSGKSTLLHVLGCLHRPSSGEYELDGQRVEDLNDVELSRLRNRKVGVVFQQFNLLPHEDILENVALPLVYAGVTRADRLRRAREVLTRLRLADRLTHRPSEVSGGQQQRVAIARAIANSPALVLADEPTGNLDSDSGLEIMGVFQEINRAGRTIIQVTHDREKAEYAGRIIHLRDGRVGSEEVIDSPRVAPPVSIDMTGGGDETGLRRDEADVGLAGAAQAGGAPPRPGRQERRLQRSPPVAYRPRLLGTRRLIEGPDLRPERA